jgi:formate hydrogenlyase subunit 6/NADH:ubiquinone oxidoreductase subunit I
MKEYRYLDGEATLTLDRDACIGCGMCARVCPHRVLVVKREAEAGKKKAEIVDFNACMECGACARNCPAEAVTVTPGVGCASYLMAVWLSKLMGRKVDSTCC